MNPDIRAKIDAAQARVAAASSSVAPSSEGGGIGGGEHQHISEDNTPPSFLVDARTYEHDMRDLPEWLVELRSHQIDAVQEIDDAFDRGAQIVFVEAPTGSGKTILGELARRRNGESGLYVCSGKSLQDQFARDFDYAGVVKGRSNYPTLLRDAWPEITAADCDKMGGDDACTWCGVEVSSCPYERAKMQALGNKLAALNTTYTLTELNYVGGFSGRDIVVVDEADLLEEELMRFVEFRITPRMVKDLGLTVPKKGVHAGTVEAWLKDEVRPAATTAHAKIPGGKDVKLLKERKRLKQLIADVDRICDAGVEFGEGGWVRTYDKKREDSFTLKPVKVAEDANKLLWRHAKRWVLMSATLVSVQEMVESLGVDEAGLTWDEVHVPPVFPVERRVIVASGVADMTRKGQEAGGVKKLLEDGIRVVVGGHRHDNILIHTHTYALARDVTMWLNQNPDVVGRREVWSYTGANERDIALERYKQHGGILVAPSMDRGIDLPGDECRVQVICKLPMPYLGDAQVSARMNARGGELWYGVLTSRGLIQMTGRAVRSVDDWATTYVLDSTFGRWKKRNKSLLPAWWQEAVKYVPGKYFAREVEARVEAHQVLRNQQ